jgi:pilus assembly protein CpaC
LRVKFAELDRSKEVQFGVNLMGIPGQTLVGSTAGLPGAPILSGTANYPGTSSGSLTIGQAFNLFAFDPKLNLGAFVQALQSESILQILAEPNLVTTNGKEAQFLVGGEFPVPILQGGGNSGAVTVQFREFGIRLIFTPNITENKTIKLHLRQEVSTLDQANGVTLSGFRIPALATRRAETDVELAEGQSFVVAGLVDNRETDLLSKIPVLGSLPIFGSLFKTKTETKTNTELIMLVTPEITEPLGPNDSKPGLFFPRDFLVRLQPKDVAQGAPLQKKASKKN